MKSRNRIIISVTIIFCLILIFAAKNNIDKKTEFEEASVNDIVITTEYTETTVENTEEIIEDSAAEYVSEVESTEESTTIPTTKSRTESQSHKQESRPQTSTTKKTSTDATAAAFYLSDEERRVVECIVMGEAGGEPYEGQILVAQCILNACKKDGLKPSQVRREYKYSGWNSNPSKSVKNAVSAVFDDGYKATNEYILYFYAPKYAKGRWHETQKFVCEVGGHRFFAEW